MKIDQRVSAGHSAGASAARADAFPRSRHHTCGRVPARVAATLASAALILSACGGSAPEPAGHRQALALTGAGPLADLGPTLMVDLLPSIERDYAAYFPEPQVDQTYGPYTYRTYSTGNSVGFDGTSLWAMGPVANSLTVPVQVISIIDHCNAHPNDCGALVNEELMVGGALRRYLVYVPWRARSGSAPPAVFVLHGGDQGGRYAYDHFGWKAQADAEGFIAVFPWALSHCVVEDSNGDGRISAADGIQVLTQWGTSNLGVTGVKEMCSPTQLEALRLSHPDQYELVNHPIADDLGFFSQMVGVLTSRYAADPKRLYLSGFSNGAEMTHRLVANQSTTFAAAHLAAGANSETTEPVATRPMSLLYSTGADGHGASLRIDVDLTQAPNFTPFFASRVTALARTVSLEPVWHDFLASQTVQLGSQRVDYSIYDYFLSVATPGASNNLTAILIADLGHEYPSWMAAPVWAWLKGYRLP